MTKAIFDDNINETYIIVDNSSKWQVIRMNFSQLKNILKVEHKEYQNIPFWSWNSTIEEEELVKQIVDMKSVGIGGFIMHARSGLSIEYLGEKWFSCIDACLKKAKELDMEAWIYDENGWPSGFVGGKLLENIDFRAQFLDYKVLDHFDENAFVVYKKIGNNYFLIDKILLMNILFRCSQRQAHGKKRTRS